MINISLKPQEFKHLASVLQLDAMTGDKQSILLWERMKEVIEEEKISR